ncbi:MAG: MSMEG_0565 family glycosyltransferase [Burkholderiales bacterium]|nr:MSMEG_0565 family glycosyltransferase [Burkholderiales bacterium]
MTPRRLRIALLTHSTNPRGGVVHCLELAEALHALGHEAVVHAPDASGAGFFRATDCRTVALPVQPVAEGLAPLVERRIADFVRYFAAPATETFDVYHAHDGIGGNALANLVECGRIPDFVRTVHHLDHFTDPRVAAWQRRSIGAAASVYCVSDLWRRKVAHDFGIEAAHAPNGVDLRRFHPGSGPADAAVLARHRIPVQGPVFLAVGGIEARKNSARMLEAFAQVHASVPQARFVIVGGASLLDHGAYRATFDAALARSALPEDAVIVTGPVADADMPALYRRADALVFASINEGFGLAVLEAMACGTPAVVSRIEPFTEWLGADDCIWVDPHDPRSIAMGMRVVLTGPLAARLRQNGLEVAARHPWSSSAQRHVELYRTHLTAREILHHA